MRIRTTKNRLAATYPWGLLMGGGARHLPPLNQDLNSVNVYPSVKQCILLCYVLCNTFYISLRTLATTACLSHVLIRRLTLRQAIGHQSGLRASRDAVDMICAARKLTTRCQELSCDLQMCPTDNRLLIH